VRLTTEFAKAQQEVERLTIELSSFRDKKLTLVVNLNLEILAKDKLVGERDTTLAEKEQALADKEQSLAEKDKISSELDKAVSLRDLAETSKSQAITERESALEKLEGVESRYQKIRRKYQHCKAKAKRLSEQLSFVPWLRTKAWAFRFHIGFENFWALAFRSNQLKISFENVSSSFLSLPSSCYSELLDLRIEYFPEEEHPEDEYLECNQSEGEVP
jgi:uncharacterized protein (DUF3084 family)